MADAVAKLEIRADGSVARKEFASVAEAAAAAGVEIGSGIGIGFQNAQAAFERLDTVLVNGNLRTLPLAVGQATYELRNLEAAIAAARAAGDPVPPEAEAGLEGLRNRLQEATEEAGRFRESMASARREINQLAKGERVGGLLGEITKSIGSLTELVAKTLIVTQVIGKSMDTLGRAVQETTRMFGGLSEEAGETVGAFRDVGKAIASLDVAELGASLGRLAGNAFVQATGSSKALSGSLDDLRASIETVTGVAQKSVEAFVAVKKAQQEWVADQERAEKLLNTRTRALVMQAEAEAQVGEIQRATREELEKLLTEWEQRGDVPPEKLQNLAQAYGLVSSVQRGYLEKIREETSTTEARTAALLVAIDTAQREGELTASARANIAKLLADELDLWARLGQEAPDALAEQARLFGVASAEARTAQQAIEGYADALLKTRVALADQTASVVGGIQAVSEAGELQGAALAKAREDVGKLLDQYLDLGEQVPPALVAVADGLGVVSARQQELVDGWDAYRDRMEAELEKTNDLLDAQHEKIASITEQLEALSEAGHRDDVDDKAAEELEMLRDKAVLTADEIVRMDRLREAVEGAEGAEKRRTAALERQAKQTELLDRLNEEMRRQYELEEQELAQRVELLDRQTAQYREYGATQAEVASGAADFAKSLSDGAQGADALGSALGGVDAAGSDLTGTLGKTREGVDALAGSARELADATSGPFDVFLEQMIAAEPRLVTIRTLLEEIREVAKEVSLGGN